MLFVAGAAPRGSGLNCMEAYTWQTSWRAGSTQTVIVGAVEFASTFRADALSEIERPSLAHSCWAAASIACRDGVTAYSSQVSPPTLCAPSETTRAPCCSSNSIDHAGLS